LSEGGRPAGEAGLTTQQLQSLRDSFERARFDELGSERGTPCADCFEYEIEHAGHIVRTEESALSDGLAALIADLNGLVSRVRGGNT
jgi:hypothetical protein